MNVLTSHFLTLRLFLLLLYAAYLSVQDIIIALPLYSYTQHTTYRRTASIHNFLMASKNIHLETRIVFSATV